MYVCYLSHSNACKNKLEEEFWNYLQEIDRTWVADEDLKKLKADILQKYQELCEKHPRCKPIKKDFSAYGSDRLKSDLNLTGANCIFKLLKTK